MIISIKIYVDPQFLELIVKYKVAKDSQAAVEALNGTRLEGEELKAELRYTKLHKYNRYDTVAFNSVTHQKESSFSTRDLRSQCCRVRVGYRFTGVFFFSSGH